MLYPLIGLAGCAGTGGVSGNGAAGFAGRYEGSFASALSQRVSDDLNFNTCTQESDCDTQHNALVDIVLEINVDERGRLAAVFFADREASRPLDLLGRGCGSRVGELESLSRDTSLPDLQYSARFALHVENRHCAGRLRPTSSHFMQVRLYRSAAGQRTAEVLIDKAVVSKNYLYVEEDGVRRRVRIDVDNTPARPQRGGYRVCIEDEDDDGEFGRCVMTDKELKQILLPVPVPGGVAVNYTWWYDLTPNLKRTHKLYELEQYVGRFQAY
jgi:hypothetical protein